MLSQGVAEGDARSELIKLAVRKIVEEALEAEVADALGRGYYENGAAPGAGYRNGYRRGRLRVAEGAIEYGVPQVADRAEPFVSRVRAGLVQLSEAAGGDFSAADAERQLAAMKQLESSPFFADMLGKTQFYFYNNKAVWPKFGYEGSSWEKGGYINRGFNDVTWTDG